MQANWYNNSNTFIYLRISTSFFRRTDGIGWQLVSQQQADEATGRWSVLHPLQEEAYFPVLKEQGLI